jgi:outer membrane lipoprotein-sorting protein
MAITARRLAASSALLILCAAAAPSQELLTAADFFKQMQAAYGAAQDYEARVSITAGKSSMSGTLSFKAPSFLRIDFDEPANQVMCYNGEELVVYMPGYSAILSQYIGKGGLDAASSNGLQLMARGFSIAYESSPSPVPLEAGSPENVIKLSLTTKTTSEGFRRIILSVDPTTKLIRRFEGTTIANSQVVLDYRSIKLNQGIPDARFIYQTPASANQYNNFLYKTE